MRMALLLIVFFIGGCSSSPSFVGVWQTDSLPADGLPVDAVSITVVIKKDGAFGVTLDDTAGKLVNGVAGTWSKMKNGGIEMMVPGLSDTTTATLLDGETLLAVSDGVAVRLQRQR